MAVSMNADHYSDLVLIAAAYKTVWIAAWNATWETT